jgi:hypothetical protein
MMLISTDPGCGNWRRQQLMLHRDEVYLRTYGSVTRAPESLGRLIPFCNMRRPHTLLDGKGPYEVYFATLVKQR